ncbi:MAG TPA: glycosyltransferase family 39 protein [archaeon]|nr:glycosyltransferase family 39 protein [archaeon]
MGRNVTADWMLKARNLLRAYRLLGNGWFVLLILFAWTGFVFYSNLGAVLIGDEALYAAIAQRIVRTKEWLPLIYQGHPYFNKPPLHFWVMALSLRLWGPGEFAIRFPTATFGIGMTVLTYCCGRVLFHRRLGVIAALITTTTLSTVWHAHEAKLDVQLGFWMNLTFFALYLAFRDGGRRLGFLCLAFFAMALGTMLKGPIALLLPALTALAFLTITRRSRVVMEIPFLAAGFAVFLLLTGAYYLQLEDAFNQHFFLSENLRRIFEGNKPALFYFYMMLANFLPWSVFLPCAAFYVWTSWSRDLSEKELLLRVWPIGFFLLLNLSAEKVERFLVYVVPPFALVMARFWEHIVSLESTGQRSTEDRLLRVTAVLLALTTMAALLVGPWLITRRLDFPRDSWPTLVALIVGIGCVGIIYTAYGHGVRAVFASVVVVVMAMTAGLVQFYYPARDRHDSPAALSRQIAAVVSDSPLLIFDDNLNFMYDILYYLNRPQPVPLLGSAEEVRAVFRSDRQVFGFMLKDRYNELKRRNDVRVVRVADYAYRRQRFVLASNHRGQSPPSSGRSLPGSALSVGPGSVGSAGPPIRVVTPVLPGGPCFHPRRTWEADTLGWAA